MYISTSTAFALAITAPLSIAHPFQPPLSPRAAPPTAFPAGTTFDILLNKGTTNIKSLTTSAAFSVIDIDLFDTDAATIADLKTSGKKVLCYFSAGTREDWRADRESFQASDIGKATEDWPGENWVDVKSGSVREVMKRRIALAREKGCDGVDPDNVDGFSGNQDGWGYKQADYAAYVKFLAQESSAAGLAIGLKNALELIPDVLDVVQFAVNEQCHEFNECALYKPFTAADKAVFNIEYGGNKCDSPAGVTLTILNKSGDQALNRLGGQCKGSSAPVVGLPAASESANGGASASATKGAASRSVSVGRPTVSATVSAVPGPSVTLGSSSSLVSVKKSSTVVATKTSAAAPSKTGGGAKPSETASDEDEDEDDGDAEENGGEDEEDYEPHRGHHHYHHHHGWGKHD